MRKDMKIPTKDGFNIYGTLDSCESRRLIIFIHGMTGNKDEHHYFNAASFFNKRGFDTFRFNFYSRKKDSRQLVDSTLTTHIDDLNAVIDKFTGDYDETILISHSFGGILVPNVELSKVSKIVFWDPSSGFNNLEDKSITYERSMDKYRLNWGKTILVNKLLIEQWMAVSVEELVDKVTVPCKFIFAGNNNKEDIWGPQLDKIKVPYKTSAIEGASHQFVEEGSEEKLFEETLKFISRSI